MRQLILFLICIFGTATVNAQATGGISGTVRDKRTQEPIVNASIVLEKTSKGEVSDFEGRFYIAGIAANTYNLKIQALGYEVTTVYNVVVSSGNMQVLSIELEPSSVKLKEVVVRRNPFQKNAETPLSVQSLSAQEIKSNPGGNFDVSRVIQAFPGVGGTSGSVGGYRNDLIIRGGAPNENVYYLDGIEVPVINHFATQGSAGGPTGIVNISFIEDVTLYTSAFPAKYDNPLSGVLQLKQRRANSEKTEHNIRLSATEVAYTANGPVNDKISYMVSARRSYLQLLFKALQVPIQPSYWDFQYKVDYRINKKLSFYTLGIGAIDKFRFLTPDEMTAENNYIIKSNPTIDQWNYTNGYGLKKLIKKGYWNLTFSRNMLDNNLDRFEDNQNPDETKRILKIQSQEIENKLRFEVNKYYQRLSYSYGLVSQYDKFSNEVFSRVRAEIRDDNGQIIQPAITVNSMAAIDMIRYGAFGQIAINLFKERLNISLGLRADGNTFINSGNELLKRLSPRLATSVLLADNLKFNTSIGRYYKLPTYTVLGYQQSGVYVNKKTSYIQSDHLVTGFEYLPWNSGRFTLEGFYKKYDNYPISLVDGISLANKGGDFNVLGNEAIAASGKGRSYGIEFQYQQKLSKNFFAILSYTYYKSEFTNMDGAYKPASWDNRHLLSFIGGYKFKKNYEIGVKFRYQGGAPYTPFDLVASQINYQSGGTGIYDYSRFNQKRLASFNAMDIRLDKRWNYKKWALDVYLDISNVYGSVQPEYPKYTFMRNADNSGFQTTDGQPLKADGSNAVPLILDNSDPVIIPTIGFIIEF